jgi:hypothetical protein
VNAENAEQRKNELDHYLNQGRYHHLGTKFDTFGSYWNVDYCFPTLRKIACDTFAIPITTLAPESALSTGTRVLSRHLSCLAPKMLEALVCSQDWLRNELQGNQICRYVSYFFVNLFYF